MLCAISGEAPQEPIASKKSGTVFEKRLIEKYIEEYAKDPVTGEELSLDDLLPLKTERIVTPRPATLTSIPSLLATFQNEWDSLALERFTLQEQLARTREELSTALYQLDGATRVVERLSRERDEARNALSRVTVSAGPTNGDAMAVDNEALPANLAEIVASAHSTLSKSRKKRPIPDGWATADRVSSFEATATKQVPVPEVSSAVIQEGFAAIGSTEGEVAIYEVASNSVETSLEIPEPVTDIIWANTKIIAATAKGSVKLCTRDAVVLSASEHAGPTTAIALHPSGDLMASVGLDKGVVLYDLEKLQRVSRIYLDSPLTTCTFHPDGHLLAAGTATGEIKLLFTNNGEQAATFTLGPDPIQAVVFSENGFFFAAAGKGNTSVTIFDIRKEGDAAVAKVLDAGGAVTALDWDYSGQFLATAGPAGVTVQQYTKSSKSWSEPLRTAVAGVRVCWGVKAQSLLVVGADGVVTNLGGKEE